jgi:hypothetical protein
MKRRAATGGAYPLTNGIAGGKLPLGNLGSGSPRWSFLGGGSVSRDETSEAFPEVAAHSLGRGVEERGWRLLQLLGTAHWILSEDRLPAEPLRPAENPGGDVVELRIGPGRNFTPGTYSWCF